MKERKKTIDTVTKTMKAFQKYVSMVVNFIVNGHLSKIEPHTNMFSFK